MLRWLIVLTLLLAPVGSAAAVTFELLDLPAAAPWIRCALSQDGGVLALNAGGRYFLWNRALGFTEIGTGHPQAMDVGVSRDGSAVCGTMVDRQGRRLAAVWHAGSGWTAIPIEGDPATDSDNLGSAYGLGGDGGVVVGLIWAGSRPTAFRWSTQTGLVRLPDAGRGSRASAMAVHRDVVVGFDEHPDTGLRRPARWIDGVLEYIAGPGSGGEILAVSADGDRCCGQQDGRAFYHDARSGLRDLGILGDDPRDRSRATAISDAGMVAGWSGDPSWGRREAFVWGGEAAMLPLTTWLRALGAAVPDSLQLTEVLAVSGDGTTMTGTWQDQHWVQGTWLVTGLGLDAHALLARLAADMGKESSPPEGSEWTPSPAKPGRPVHLR